MPSFDRLTIKEWKQQDLPTNSKNFQIIFFLIFNTKIVYGIRLLVDARMILERAFYSMILISLISR